jgi:DNA-binding phage protein
MFSVSMASVAYRIHCGKRAFSDGVPHYALPHPISADGHPQFETIARVLKAFG